MQSTRTYHMSVKGIAATGMLWASYGVVVSKFASFTGQFFLGWLLSKDDFGLYAIAISASSFLVPLLNCGIHKILLQRCNEYDELAPDLYKMALLFNVLIMFALIALIPVTMKWFVAPELSVLLAIIAVSLPLRTPGSLIRAKLLNQQGFKEEAKIGATSSLVRHLTAVLFAFAGFGPVSFVLPLLMVALYENFAYWKAVRYWPNSGRINWGLYKSVLRDAKWVLVGSLMLTLSQQSDYLIVGFFEDKATLGIYFFAFQLSVSFMVLFNAGIESVMMPSFSRLFDQPQRQNQAFVMAFGMLSFVAAPLVIGISLVIEPVVNFLWAGKWDDAIVATQLILVSLVTRIPMVLHQTYLEARGMWRRRAIIQGVDTLGMVLAATIGAWSGGVIAIALTVSLYRLISGFLFPLFGCLGTEIDVKGMAASGGVVGAIVLLLGFVALTVAKTVAPSTAGLAATISLGIFVFMLIIYGSLFERQRVADFLSLARIHRSN